MYIFGYGSLISPRGINGRKMRHFYQEKDLTDVTLKGYVRGWTGHYFDTAYLGISKGKKTDEVNGVVFKVDLPDLRPFMNSEGFGSECPPYILEKVNIPGFREVYTCLVENPDFEGGVIPWHYLFLIDDLLKKKSKAFQRSFHKNTVHNQQAERFFKAQKTNILTTKR